MHEFIAANLASNNRKTKYELIAIKNMKHHIRKKTAMVGTGKGLSACGQSRATAACKYDG